MGGSVGGGPKAISGAIFLPTGGLYYFVLFHFVLFNIVFPKYQGLLLFFLRFLLFVFLESGEGLIGPKAV